MNGNILAEDIKAVLESKDLFKQLDAPFQFFGKVYSASDNAARAVVYENEVASLVKMFPHLAEGVDVKSLKGGTRPPAKLLEAASEMAKDHYQDYERVSRKIRELSKHGVLPQFVTFTAEFARNLFKQVKNNTAMIRGKFGADYGLAPPTDQKAIAAMRSEGLKRMSSLMAVTGVGGGAAIYGANRTGFFSKEDIDEDRENAFRRILPSFAKNKPLLFSYDSETKLGAYANASYIIPHAIPTSLITAVLSGSDERDLVQALTEEFVGEGTFLTKSIINAMQNRTGRGQKISYAIDDTEYARDLIAYIISDTFTPGIVNEASKFIKATEGKGDYSVAEVLQRQAGLRFFKFSTDDLIRFKFQDLMDSESGFKGQYSVAREYRELSPEQLEAEYEKANNGARVAYEGMNELYVDMTQNLGYSQEEAVKLMLSSDSKLSKKNAFRIINGLPFEDIPRFRPQTTFEKYDQFVIGRSNKEIRDGLRSLYREDAVTARSLEREHKRRLKAERRNIPLYYQTFLGLDVQSRAEFIVELGLDRNQAELRRLAQYGIYNKNVKLAIKQMQ